VLLPVVLPTIILQEIFPINGGLSEASVEAGRQSSLLTSDVAILNFAVPQWRIKILPMLYKALSTNCGNWTKHINEQFPANERVDFTSEEQTAQWFDRINRCFCLSPITLIMANTRGNYLYLPPIPGPDNRHNQPAVYGKFIESVLASVESEIDFYVVDGNYRLTSLKSIIANVKPPEDLIHNFDLNVNICYFPKDDMKQTTKFLPTQCVELTSKLNEILSFSQKNNTLANLNILTCRRSNFFTADIEMLKKALTPNILAKLPSTDAVAMKHELKNSLKNSYWKIWRFFNKKVYSRVLFFNFLTFKK
jgi:hypothetical protein